MFDHHVYVQFTGNSPKVLVKNSMDGRKRSVIKGFINMYTLKRSMFYISWIYFIFCFLKFWVGTEILFFFANDRYAGLNEISMSRNANIHLYLLTICKWLIKLEPYHKIDEWNIPKNSIQRNKYMYTSFAYTLHEIVKLSGSPTPLVNEASGRRKINSRSPKTLVKSENFRK